MEWHDFEVGSELVSYSEGPITVTDFVRYQGASGDMNPIHHDYDYARKAGFAGPFAVGMRQAGVLERLVHGEVRVVELHVFADQRDLDLVVQLGDPLGQLAPVGEVGLARRKAEALADEGVEPLRRETLGDEVHVRDVGGREHGARVDVGEQRDFNRQRTIHAGRRTEGAKQREAKLQIADQHTAADQPVEGGEDRVMCVQTPGTLAQPPHCRRAAGRLGLAPRRTTELAQHRSGGRHTRGAERARRRLEPDAMSQSAAIQSRVKRLIVESLNLEGMRPEMIEDETPLFGEGLGLDSVDALELVVALEKEFGIRIKSQEIGREVFSSVSSLSQFIEGRT